MGQIAESGPFRPTLFMEREWRMQTSGQAARAFYAHGRQRFQNLGRENWRPRMQASGPAYSPLAAGRADDADLLPVCSTGTHFRK